MTTLHTYADTLAVRRLIGRGCEVVVIGGGFIGLEVAASAVARGASRDRARGWPAAAAAAGNILGASRPYEDVPWFWSDQYDGPVSLSSGRLDSNGLCWS